MSKLTKKRRNRKHDHRATLEKLEDRQMYSVVSVTPQNFIGAINNSSSGDTINFAPGTYTLATNPNGAAATFPTGRKYVGNGATFALSGGVTPNDNGSLINFNGSSATTEVTGFTFTDGQVACTGGAFNVHNNTFTNGRTGLYVAGQSGHFDHNTFTHLSGFGIYGYPGNNNTFDNNNFDYVWEPVHLISTGDGIDVSNNVITHASRIGIELQSGMTHLTVNNNWMSDWLPFLDSRGLDCAHGHLLRHRRQRKRSLPRPGQAHHYQRQRPDSERSVQNNNVGAKAAIEIMGDEDINITSNYAWGWDCGVLNGCTGQGVNSSNNTWVCNKDWSGDGVGWPNPVPAWWGEQGLFLYVFQFPGLAGRSQRRERGRCVNGRLVFIHNHNYYSFQHSRAD